MVDVALRVNEPLPLRKRKKKSGYHSNYEELKTPEQRYRLLNQLESSERTNKILSEWKQSGIEIKNVSGKSLLKKALPPAIYDSLKSAGIKAKKTLGPSYIQMTDAVAKSGVKLMGDRSRNDSQNE